MCGRVCLFCLGFFFFFLPDARERVPVPAVQQSSRASGLSVESSSSGPERHAESDLHAAWLAVYAHVLSE